jgi:hypothetical protein
MKTRFKIIGKCPTSATKYSLTGTVTKPGKAFTTIADTLSAYFDSSCKQERPQIPADEQPTAKTIVITLTLP